MFDIGFWELSLIGVVALLVIGPERLPGVARTAGKWIGSARRFMSSVQADINVEVGKADELKRLLEEQTKIQSVHEILETPVDINADNEKDARKPVPREKPDYLVKAMPVESADESTDSKEQNTEQKSAEQKHD